MHLLLIAGLNVNPVPLVVVLVVIGVIILGGALFGHGGSISMEVPYEKHKIENDHPNATVHWTKTDPDGSKRSMTNKGGRSYVMVKRGDDSKNPKWR